MSSLAVSRPWTSRVAANRSRSGNSSVENSTGMSSRSAAICHHSYRQPWVGHFEEKNCQFRAGTRLPIPVHGKTLTDQSRIECEIDHLRLQKFRSRAEDKARRCRALLPSPCREGSWGPRECPFGRTPNHPHKGGRPIPQNFNKLQRSSPLAWL